MTPKMKVNFQSYKFSFICILWYLITIFILQYFAGCYQNFSDATHYLWIADKYAEGDKLNAINTYWGPMISWFLFLLNGVFNDPFLKFRFLQILLGAFTVIYFNLLLNKKMSDKKISLVATLVFTPAISSYVWFYHTPDLLLLFFTILLLYSIDKLFIDKRANLLFLAFIGACMYFTKSVGLYFFVLLFLMKFLTEKDKFNKENFLRYLKLGMYLLLFISPWIALISLKNNGFTLGTGSMHNYNMNSPRITPDIYGELGNPYHLGQLTNPFPANAFDACIEHMHQKYPAWEGYSSSERTTIYFKIAIKNMLSARSMFFGIDPGFIFLILLVAGMAMNKNVVSETLKQEKELVFVFILNAVLYLPFFFMERYTWPGSTALLILSVLLFTKTTCAKNEYVKSMFFSSVLLLNVYLVIKEINYAQPEKTVINELWNTNGKLKLDRTVWICKKEDKRLGIVKGVIYYNHGQYLGALFSDVSSSAKIKNELMKFNIHHLITLEPLNEHLKKDLGLKKLVYNSGSLNIYVFEGT